MTTKQPRVSFAALAVALGALTLAACASAPVVKSPPAAALVCNVGETSASASDASCMASIAEIAARAAADTASQPAWSMQGRAAISTGKQSGNARIDWQQRGSDDYSVTLSAPITRQSWRLDVAAGQARLSGLDGGPRQAGDAEQLLREATGWDIPVAALRDWLRGLPAGGAPPQHYAFAADGGLIGLDQAGWHIEFERADAQALPRRISASRADSRVRLVVDQWGDAAGE